MRTVIHICFLFVSLSGFSQSRQPASVSKQPVFEFANLDTLADNIYAGNTDQQAKQAVGKIMRYTGLPQNFIVVAEGVSTAVAYVKNKERYIAYNETFINRIADSTNTDWSAISILAHEIAHHLAGHTIDLKNSSPGDELEADVFSGFILYRMGATIDEAMAAMKEFNPDTTDNRYPPKEARLLAIKSGWTEAKSLTDRHAMAKEGASTTKKETAQLVYELTFNGDKNTYYVDSKNRVIWFDDYGTAIVIGDMAPSETKKYKWVYTSLGTNYGVDAKGRIWMMTDHGAMINSGQVYSYTK